MRSNSIQRVIVIAILALVLVIGLLMLNSQLVKFQPTEKNFLVPWLGMRTYLEFGDDPYGLPATQRAQVLYYGNLAKEKQDPLYLSLPYFTEILFFPIGLVGNYAIARVVWLLLLESCLVGSALVSLSYFDWKANRPLKVLYFLVSVIGTQAVMPLINHSIVIIAFFLFWIGLLCLKRGLDEFSGAALTVALFLKISIWLLLLFVVWWVVRNRRWRVIWGMLMAGGFLIALSILLYPGWFFPYLKALRNELDYFQTISTYSTLTIIWPAIGSKVAGLLTVVVLAFLANEWRLMKPERPRWFLWGISLTIIAMPILGTPILREDLLFLWFPFSFLLFNLDEIIGRRKVSFVTGVILSLVLVSAWFLSLGTRLKLIGSTDVIIKLIMPSFILAVWLYWIRWRNLKSPKNILEMDSLE